MRRPTRVRARLTALYGMLFTISGAALLGILYLLVSNSPKTTVRVHVNQPGPGPGMPTAPPPTSFDQVQVIEETAVRQHDALLQGLLERSGIALAIMVVFSIFLGWLVAGRILRPLRAMTQTIHRISASNLHERLAIPGPDDEIKDLANTVDALLNRLESALDAHKRFVANAAHELRTPLTLEHALVEEVLLDRGADAATFRAVSGRVLEICRQQERLLESLLTLTTGERGLDRREGFDLAALAGTALEPLRADLDRRGLSLRAGLAPARSSGDPALVERLIANLLDNAIDYNVEHGFVELETGSDGDRALVRVTNSGRHVPPEHVDQIFEPFHRLDRSAGRSGHHGLGLSIVRSIANAHDARLTPSARPGGGLVVEVSFPLDTETAQTPPAALTGTV
ncbi:ATP-binding protein [Nonomuraea sp. B12E4]|uniref:sensor histidine kinase n=1 Tax=Nonomuraea sp. B12E4 TaxID=3153564 RepID=UPI00325EB982